MTSRSQPFPAALGGNTFGRPARCVEVRAAAAQISELCVYDDGMERLWPAAEVVELLAQAYKVPVSVAEPPYTACDWDEKLLPEYRYLQVGLTAPGVAAHSVSCLANILDGLAKSRNANR